MNIILQKFGGTTLKNKTLRLEAAKQVLNKKEAGYSPVVVVSAIGRKGDAYSTDTLLHLALEEHEKFNDREKDLLLTCGETISAVIMAQTLRRLGMQAVVLQGFQAGILTDSVFGNAKVKKVHIAKLISILKEGKIPVVCGFQGISESGEITTLGRGGSDTTASVLGVALQAEEIMIYTDVAGIKSADPNKLSEADDIETASYEEAVELAYQGANVIHPRAVEIATEADIPLHILSVANDAGTMIKNIRSDKPVTGISSKTDIILIRITADPADIYNSGIKVFPILAEKAVSVDFIDIRNDSINFVIDAEKKELTNNLLKKNNFIFELQSDLIKISVVGSGMTGQPGIMAKIVQALHLQNIRIHECTDSRTTISCLIDKTKEIEALQALHKVFELEKR